MTPDVVSPGQYLCPFHDLRLCDRRHGSLLYVHAQTARGARDVVVALDVLVARCGGMSQSCHSAPGLRGGVVRRQLWISAIGVSVLLTAGAADVVPVPSAARASLLRAILSAHRPDCPAH